MLFSFSELLSQKDLPVMRRLKNPHRFPEKDSIFRKFQTFVSQTRIPGERTFGFLTVLCLMTSSAQADWRWKVPNELGQAGYRAELVQGVVLLGSSHSSWLYGYKPEGELLWKRQLGWPLNQSLQSVGGLALWPRPGWLVQPETGELRLLPPSPGFTVPGPGDSWLHINNNGQLFQRLSQNWEQLGQLRLLQGETWIGPPLYHLGKFYAISSNGALVEALTQKQGWNSRVLTRCDRPLSAPLAHPRGLVLAGLSGRLQLCVPGGKSWTRASAAWENCYSQEGTLVALPCVLGQTIVQASRQQIHAYSASGEVLWERSLAASCSPLVWQNRLFICNQEPTLLELHPDTGQVLHRRPLSAPPSTQPHASGQQLALALKDGQVVICNLP
jgi:outer membrane protein assembly factor BamB